MRGSGWQRRTPPSGPAEMRGLFLGGGALQSRLEDWEWECPWCEFSIAFGERDRLVAEGAARHHLLSVHHHGPWRGAADDTEALRTPLGAWAKPGGEES